MPHCSSAVDPTSAPTSTHEHRPHAAAATGGPSEAGPSSSSDQLNAAGGAGRLSFGGGGSFDEGLGSMSGNPQASLLLAGSHLSAVDDEQHTHASGEHADAGATGRGRLSSSDLSPAHQLYGPACPKSDRSRTR